MGSGGEGRTALTPGLEPESYPLALTMERWHDRVGHWCQNLCLSFELPMTCTRKPHILYSTPTRPFGNLRGRSSRGSSSSPVWLGSPQAIYYPGERHNPQFPPPIKTPLSRTQIVPHGPCVRGGMQRASPAPGDRKRHNGPSGINMNRP